LRLNRKLLITLVLLAVVTAAALYVWAEDRREQKNEAILEDIDRFGYVLGRIIDFYVDEIGSEELIDSAIRGMLKELDPHSVYLNKQQWENLMIDTRGEFGGLGITISIRDDFPTVISPIEDTPAYRLGIQAGDRIVEIEKESTNGWSSDEAVSKLRGPPGTQVNITIAREGLEDSLYFAITRDVITVPSITFWDTIEEVGYIRVSRFAERTARDLDEIVTELEKEGVKGLILDLRSNPGGLLDAAREVSELFLERDKLIVYTEGRITSNNQKFRSRSRKVHDGYPIVILVNGASASASEIVAGALQDWDKAIIIGQPTFGKGSVQTVFKVGDEGALKLTTMKYYTPSGRSIHRDELDEDVEQESQREVEEFYTHGGRIVYGGGGITPDWEIELPEFTDLQRQLELKLIFFSFAVHYSAYHNVDEDFEVTDEVLTEFIDFVKEKDVEVKKEDWDEENIEYAKLGIKREIFRKMFGARGAFMATLRKDEEINEVLNMFVQAPSLTEMFAYVEQQKHEKAE